MIDFPNNCLSKAKSFFNIIFKKCLIFFFTFIIIPGVRKINILPKKEVIRRNDNMAFMDAGPFAYYLVLPEKLSLSKKLSGKSDKDYSIILSYPIGSYCFLLRENLQKYRGESGIGKCDSSSIDRKYSNKNLILVSDLLICRHV